MSGARVARPSAWSNRSAAARRRPGAAPRRRPCETGQKGSCLPSDSRPQHLDYGPQAVHCPLDPGPGSFGRDAESRRDLLKRQIKEVAKDENEAVAVTNPAQRAPEVDRLGKIGGQSLRFRWFDLEHRPPRAPAHFAALVGHDAEKPRPEARAFTQVAQPAPRLEGSLLDGVLRLVGIVEQSQSESKSHVVLRSQELREGGTVAMLGVPDELSLRVPELHALHILLSPSIRAGSFSLPQQSWSARSVASAEERAFHDVEDRHEGEDGCAQDRIDQRQQRGREVDERPG